LSKFWRKVLHVLATIVVNANKLLDISVLKLSFETRG
jgi:hypothetical protein